LILALELYLRNRERLPDSDDVEIVELSRTLNSLFGEQANDATLFRNPDGVYMKLANFRAVDPLHTSQGKRGLSRGGHGVAEVWEEFSTRADELKLIAFAIRAAATDRVSTVAGQVEEGAEAEEGRLLTRMHRVRERNRELEKRKRDAVLRETGRLACEAPVSISMRSMESMVAGSSKCIICSRSMRSRPAHERACKTSPSFAPIAIAWCTRQRSG
jgi:5-methylcytosine-specific restriction protein A